MQRFQGNKALILALMFLTVGGCGFYEHKQPPQFYGVSDQDAAACRLQVAQALGPAPETLSRTLDQVGQRRSLMSDCLISKGYKPNSKE